MKEMNAENATFLLHGVYLPALKNESQLTKKVIEAVPGDKSDYRPDPISKTAMELVRHIAATDNRFVETVIVGQFNTGAIIPEGLKTPAEIAAWYEQRYAGNLEALSKLSSEQLLKIVDFRGMFQRPAVTFLMMGLHHTIHHRGQLSSYLRCMGAKVPSIYGESYDAEQARKAAQA
ncbi:MAG: DinB family protein [Candidatus Acidiferrum sp.]